MAHIQKLAYFCKSKLFCIIQYKCFNTNIQPIFWCGGGPPKSNRTSNKFCTVVSMLKRNILRTGTASIPNVGAFDAP